MKPSPYVDPSIDPLYCEHFSFYDLRQNYENMKLFNFVTVLEFKNWKTFECLVNPKLMSTFVKTCDLKIF